MKLHVPPMRSGATFVAILAALAIMTCALWLPFGWRVTGTFEEWDVVGKADRLGTLSQLFVYPINRPLFQAPMVIAHWLTPGSFLGMNVIQALLIFGASAALYCLVLELMPANRALAFVTAALLLVYPADDASYTLRATNIHAGTLSLLIALCLLTASLRKTTPPRIIAMIAMEALSLAIYDGGLLIALCSPWLILLCTQCKITRRTSLVSLAWLAVPAFFAYALWRAVRDPGTYQGSLIRSAGLGHDYSHTAYVLAQSIWRALTHNFWSGWIHATTLPTANDPYLRIAVALALFAFAPLVWTLYGRTQKPRSVVTDARYWMLAAAGVAIVVMGFAMFLPTTWRDTNWRVFLYSSIGASLTVTVVCWIAASVFQSGSRAVFVVLSGALFTVGGVHALEQHGLYFAQTQRQQEILAGIVASAPKVASPVSFLLVDQTPSAAFKAWSMCTSIGDCLEDQLRYVYHGVDLRAAYCAPHFRSRGDSSEECEFGPDGVTVSYTYLGNGKPVHKHFPYGALLIFVDEPTGVRLIDDLRDVAPAEVAGTYDPKAIVDASAPPPQRVHALFTRWPFKPTYPRRREVPSYRFDFDRPAPGDGWSVPEGSHMWTDDPEATLDLWLRRGTDYRMEWRIIAAMAPDILSSLHVKVNGHPLQVEVHPDAGGAVTYVATIPAADVATDPLGTRIAFTVDRVVTPKSLGMNNDERTLGVMFDWIRIDPSTSD